MVRAQVPNPRDSWPSWTDCRIHLGPEAEPIDLPPSSGATIIVAPARPGASSAIRRVEGLTTA